MLGQDSKVVDPPRTLRVGEFLALGILSLCPGGTAAWNVRLRFGNDLLAQTQEVDVKVMESKHTKVKLLDYWLLFLMIFYVITINCIYVIFIPVL